MEKIEPFIKWSGSKKSQAKFIASHVPNGSNTYYEPFLGSGAVLGRLQPQKAICADINKSLIDLWELIQKEPNLVIKEYEKNWKNLQKDYKFFYKTRDKFNKEKSPHHLLFLSRTCVNGLIRYNKQGEFNNSLHYTRKGIHPERLKKIIFGWTDRIKNCNFVAKDYRQATKKAQKGDFVYLDPPYFNTKGRYFGAIDFNEFIDYLRDLNKREIKFALSYDGIRAEKNYIVKIPKDLYKRHLLISSGNSTFKKVQDKQIEKVFESLYLNY
jgi:DNA adenine methylase